MPAIVGAIKVNSISSSGVFHIGDVFNISPRSQAKTFAGAGSFMTGDGIQVRNDYNATQVNDTDLVDQPMAGNI